MKWFRKLFVAGLRVDAIRSWSGAKGWHAAWKAVREQLGPYLHSIWGWIMGAATMIAALIQDIGWVGVAVLSFAALVAARPASGAGQLNLSQLRV